MGPFERVVVLVDMDCFYCQVEEKLDPTLSGKPIAVVQYNAWRGGGIIAVNYPARDKGVTRHMRGNEAKAKCPELQLCSVPEVRGKADLTKYRDAGKSVAEVLQTFTNLLERASVDEAYLDITEAVQKRIDLHLDDLKAENMKNTYVVGYETGTFLHNTKTNPDLQEANLKLAVGGVIVEEIRKEVFNKTGFKCSAGIAHNKVLAKLVCGFHKPNKQTILPHESIQQLFETLPLKKIKSLGGKFGSSLTEQLGITYVGELVKFSEKELIRRYDERNGSWLYNIGRGIDLEPVTTRLVSKSIGCCKKFAGKGALITPDSVEHWLKELCEEISERLEKDLEENNRKAKQMVVSFSQEINEMETSGSRTHPLNSYDKRRIAQSALEVIKKNCQRADGNYCIKFLGISANNFEDIKNVRSITSFFKVGNCSKNDETGQNDIFLTIAKNHIKEFDLKSFSDVKSESINDFKNDDGSDDSIYSATTEELDENVDNLVFYDNICRLEKGNNLAESEDSIGCEIFNEKTVNDARKIAERPPSASFFERYFDKVAKNRNKSRRPQLNQGGEETTILKTVEENTQSNEICSECKKKIPINEFDSHKDYHYAVKLSKDEKSTQKNMPKTSNGKTITKNKRKADQISRNNLMAFFKKEELYGNTETCDECGKKVPIEDMSNHIDYHVAKKLHLEINAGKPKSIPDPVNKKLNSKSIKSKNINSIASFFKPI